MAVRVLSGVVGQTAQGVASTDFQAGVQTVAALQALDENSRADKQIRLLEDKGNSYRFDLTSTAATDGDEVIRPDDVGSDSSAGRWIKIVGLGGDVVGPASSTDNSIARYSGTGGKTVQGSAVYIDDSGNLGVGTANPAVSLDVIGIGSFAGAAASLSQGNVQVGVDSGGNPGGELMFHTDDYVGLRCAHAGALPLAVKPDGKVGIGTTSPAQVLDVIGTASFALAEASLSQGNIQIGVDSGGDPGGEIMFHTDDYIGIRCADSGALSLAVKPSGNVGIGDVDPGTQLQMAGTAPYVTLKNSTSENTAGGCESKIIFEDHGDNALGQIEVSHVGTSDDEKGQLILSTNNDSGLQAALTISEAQAATFAGNVDITGGLSFDAGTAVTSIDTDISSVSGSDDTLASAKAIKTYVDAQVTASDLDATTDSGTIAIDLDSETLTIAGGEGIDTSATGNTITVAAEEGTAANKGVVIVAGGTGASVSYSSGTATVAVGGLTVSEIAGATLVTESEGIGSNDNDTTLPTSAAVKDYVDTKVTAEDLDITTDSGTIDIDLDGDTFTITGGEGIDTSASGTTVTIACEESTAANKGAVIVAGGTGATVSYSSGTATVAVDAAQTGITSVGTLTALAVSSSSDGEPDVTVTNTNASANGASIQLVKNVGSGEAADGDTIGTFIFKGDDDANTNQLYAKIDVKSKETAHNSEVASIDFVTCNSSSSASTAMDINNTTAGAITHTLPTHMRSLFAANVAGSFGTFADEDATPSVATGNLWKSEASVQTITMFDGGVAGQTIHVISTAAITYDVTGTNLKGGSTDIVTASGDITSWFFDGTNWYLVQFMDVSADHSSVGGGGVSIANDANNRVVTADGSSGVNGEANLTFDGSTLKVNGGVIHKRTSKDTSSVTSYTLVAGDYYIGVNSAGGTAQAITLTLPAVSGLDGTTYVVKDEDGDAGGATITIDADGSETIDGAASITITSAYGAVTLLCTGSAWSII